MNPKSSSIVCKFIVSIVVILSFLVWPASIQQAKATSGNTATKTRLSGQIANFLLEESDRSVFVTVTRDEIANTTSLEFGYRIPDPNDTNLTIIVIGDPGDIPNSAFTINATSAHLALTTPDSYSVTRCVFHDETGESTCAPTGPSTFDLTWIVDDSFSFQEKISRVETAGSLTVRSRGRYDQVSATVSGVWDGYSGTDMPGYLIDSENVTRIRERTMEASPFFFGSVALQARIQSMRRLTERGQEREAFTVLYDEDDGVNGFVAVAHNEGTDATMVIFGYGYPDPNDPSKIFTYAGFGEIPNSAFTITSASAQLSATTTDSFEINHCVITLVGGAPGSTICNLPSTPITFDLTWTGDGYGSLEETIKNVTIEGSVITKYDQRYSEVTAPANGTWNDAYAHIATNMIGALSDFQVVTKTTEPH